MDIESRTIRQVSARIVPFLIVCYFVSYLDRVNVGYAALTMNKDLGLDSTSFGIGAGIFFIAISSSKYPPTCSSSGSVHAAGLRASCSPGACFRG